MGRQYIAIDPKTGKPGSFYGEHVTRQITAQGTWAASTALNDIALDRDLLITNIRLLANMVTNALAATAYADAPKRVLQTLSIVGDGKNFLSLTGGTMQLGVLLALLNQYDTQAANLGVPVPFGATAIQQLFQFHPGRNPRDKFDMSAYIPARALSNLVARIGCPAAAVTDPGAGTIASGTYTFEIDGIQGVPISPGAFYPAPYVQAYPHTALMPNFSALFDVPTGGFVRRAVILAVDNTAVSPARSDAQITGVQLSLPKDSKNILTTALLQLKYDNAMKYGVVGDVEPTALGAVNVGAAYQGNMNVPNGFAIVDMRDYFDPVLGLNMVNAQQGDAKLGLTVGVATGQTLIYWDIWYPMAPEWIGK
jgi:hypothetical protein